MARRNTWRYTMRSKRVGCVTRDFALKWGRRKIDNFRDRNGAPAATKPAVDHRLGGSGPID